ncbi:MAG: TSUP family transporter [Acidimicrobiia bacterium]|nr:TSUP family transporter [Acidimicrobiia bacterium]
MPSTRSAPRCRRSSPSAVSGTLRYRQEGLIRWEVVAWVGAVGAVSAVGGSLLSHVVPGGGHVLMVMTAGLVAFTAWRMGRSPRGVESPEPLAAAPDGSHHSREHTWKLAVTGVGAGGLSGLLGVGAAS